jgi:hypothetical protein
MRWLTGWITHPSPWIDVAIWAAVGATLLPLLSVMFHWP